MAAISWSFGTWLFVGFFLATVVEALGYFLFSSATGHAQSLGSAYRQLRGVNMHPVSSRRHGAFILFSAGLIVGGRCLMICVVTGVLLNVMFYL